MASATRISGAGTRPRSGAAGWDRVTASEASTGAAVSRKSSAEPLREMRLNTAGEYLLGPIGFLCADRSPLHHGPGQRPVGGRALGAARILKDGHAGQWRFGKADAVFDDDVEHGFAKALANQFQHLLRVQRPGLVDGGQDASDAQLRVEFDADPVDGVLEQLH